jgi:hypothetical protein
MIRETYQEALDHLAKSIDDHVRYLTNIRNDIRSGIYTPEMAVEDIDNMTNSEGNDIISSLHKLAEGN